MRVLTRARGGQAAVDSRARQSRAVRLALRAQQGRRCSLSLQGGDSGRWEHVGEW